MSSTYILKFGGTSLQNASFIRQAVSIVRERAEQAKPVVVVSALAGVTDRLLQLAELPPDNNRKARQLIDALADQHREILEQVATDTDSRTQLDELFKELSQNYQDAAFKTNQYGAWRDQILSVGERASARIFAAALSADQLVAIPVETQHLIKTDDRFGEANILAESTRELLSKGLLNIDKIAVITGFIGSNRQKQITTLGRSGSDYTAGLVADALKADRLEIWTDVNGVLTADPKIVPDAQNLDRLSFDDIAELSAHGAKVIHPKTVTPVRESNISVYVRNTFEPNHPGTWIHKDHTTNGDFRSVTLTGPFVYFELPGRLALEFAAWLNSETPGTAESDVFSFSQNSDHESAQFVIRQEKFEKLRKPVEEWTAQHQLQQIEFRKDLLRLNTFTNRLNDHDEPLARILQLLKNEKLRPISIHRENNRRYFSLLLPGEEARQAARIINEYLTSELPVVEVFLAGIGAVGGTLLEKLLNHKAENLSLKVIGICNSRTALYNFRGLDTEKPVQKLTDENESTTNWREIVKTLTGRRHRTVIFVDATGSEDVARYYPELLEAGVHIATPSKLANTFEQDFYRQIRARATAGKASFRYETTVGAGLPVISTINDLQQSGDTITELSGVVSGTMTYLFNEVEEGTPFSKAVVKARELGYAEPDPRDDLSGEDVARKFLTLARETGLCIERDEIEVESLIPESLQDTDLDEFLERLKEYDNEWKERSQRAAKRGETLRYTGKLRNGVITIGVESLPKDSPLGQLKGTDNLLRIHSRCYDQSPIIVQGPGAGREVTASGLLTDILKIARETAGS